ncbi:caspase family protein [Sphaerisporangium aureirubrum]|uniref:Caspase domain-containing protein n=1 Tax=Sphaerisporangium aureirubrum TaxID=1544736 RepID=A0ABW1NG61_9ACTN
MRLADPVRSRAVLIGTANYQSPQMPGLPAVRNNVASLQRVLTDPRLGALHPSSCRTIVDPHDFRELYRFTRAAAMEAQDTLLVYYAGHGLIGPRRHELYLSLTDTDPDDLRITALDFEMLREIIRSSPAVNRVLILDCCYSGRAAVPAMAGEEGAVLGQIDISGTYTLTSSPANRPSTAPWDETYTTFTGALLTLLTEGLPQGPELLSLGHIYRALRHSLITAGHPTPSQLGTDTTDSLALTRNAAHGAPPSPAQARTALAAPEAGETTEATTPSSAAKRHAVEDGLDVKGNRLVHIAGPVTTVAAQLAIAGLLSSWLGETSSSQALVVIWWAWLICAIWALATIVIRLTKPFSLRVDRQGIATRQRKRRMEIDWNEISYVTLQPRGAFRTKAICVYPYFGNGHSPAAHMAAELPTTRRYPPWREPRTNVLVIAHTWQFTVPPAKVVAALEHFGGSRWRA